MAKRKSRRGSSSMSINKTMSSMNHSHDCMCCGPNSRGLGWLFLIIGLLFLLTDLNWMSWWSVNWWTILFILAGLVMIKKS